MSKQNLFTAKSYNQYNFSIIFISLLLIVYPATLFLVPKINGLIFALFSISGIVLLFSDRHKSVKTNRDETLFYLSITLFFLVNLFINLYGGFVYKVVGKYIHVLLAIPIYIYLRNVRVKQFYIWYGLVVGSIIAGIIAVYEVKILNLYRAHGITSAIIFGNLSLAMGCMSMAGFGWFKQRANWQIVFPIISFICGILASVSSVTRGGWLALPFLVIVFFWYMKQYLLLRQKLAVVVTVVVVFSAMYSLQKTDIDYHINRSINSLVQYYDNYSVSNKMETSIGVRIDMWRASWNMFIENPVMGVGWGHYYENAQIQVEQGLFTEVAILFDHPHSEYFSVLASGGSLGFIVLMVLFLIPARLFIKYIRHGKTADTRRLALAGLVLIVAYMVFGISEPLLYRSRSVNFFAFYLAVFMAAIYGQEKDEVVSLN